MRTPHVALGSASAKSRPNAHVIGRFRYYNYLSLPHGRAAVDAIAGRLAAGEAERHSLSLKLRNAVLSAHRAGWRRIGKYYVDDPGHLATALRAIRALSELVDDSDFMAAISSAELIVAAQDQAYGADVRGLARALDNVPLIEAVLRDARRNLIPVKRQNPGWPYMAGLIDSLVTFWQELTGELPSKTHKAAKK